MKVIWKFLDLKCGRYVILRNLIKLKKIILEGKMNWLTSSHLGQWHKLHNITLK
jgi:hypothetical protein